MTERLYPQVLEGRITDRYYEWYERLDEIAANMPTSADAFAQAMADAADQLGPEYAADFRERLDTTRINGWPNPDLLAEIKERNPEGMADFLDRFQALREQQIQDYEAAVDQLKSEFTGGILPLQTESDSAKPSRWSRLRALARTTLRGGESIHL